MQGNHSFELTCLIPCLSEQTILANCIKGAQDLIASLGVSGEILVVDNSSTDGSV